MEKTEPPTRRHRATELLDTVPELGQKTTGEHEFVSRTPRETRPGGGQAGTPGGLLAGARTEDRRSQPTAGAQPLAKEGISPRVPGGTTGRRGVDVGPPSPSLTI